MTITPQTDLAIAQALLAQKAEIDRLREERDRLRNALETIANISKDAFDAPERVLEASQSLALVQIEEMARAANGEGGSAPHA